MNFQAYTLALMFLVVKNRIRGTVESSFFSAAKLLHHWGDYITDL
jgi:hypothetical protein